MRILLDTHILFWLFHDARGKMPLLAEQLLSNPSNQILYSTAAPWEVQIKHMAHPDRMLIDAQQLIDLCQESGLDPLPITNDDILQLGSLSRAEDRPPHNDPFDRIMIAQAKANDLVFLTHDSKLNDYDEPCVLYV